jgi:hypothetical protein
MLIWRSIDASLGTYDVRTFVIAAHSAKMMHSNRELDDDSDD